MFQVSVPAGMPYGSFTLGIRKADTDYYLWCWHFWVTDHNPDKFNRSVITTGRYTYPVPGGQVERYVDNGAAIWSNKYEYPVTVTAVGRDYSWSAQQGKVVLRR